MEELKILVITMYALILEVIGTAFMAAAFAVTVHYYDIFFRQTEKEIAVGEGKTIRRFD